MPSSSVLFDSSAFMGAMRLITPVLNAAAVPILEATGEAIVVVAKGYAPVDTDALQQDIKVQGSGVDAKGPYVDVGTTEPYALYQEFGTEHNPPHPFMRPAIASVTGGGAESMISRLALAPRRRKK